ncbi:DMT family transporter [Aliikangiella sp. G2MR2-5]|uniref:DMT family transporter n=1 Tax=Aliikangiella sp. G2MR2-5 TaxID=2788943 RepID=UPI0018AA7B39|nr:DMT family transporter [Aliikangiella sp. G2MR2-5]
MRNISIVMLAIISLIAGNLFATFVDVIVKLTAAEVSVYQYIFLRQLAVFTILLPFWLRLSKVQRNPINLKVHCARAVLTNIGGPSAVIAILYLPLATANVIFYSAPLITVLMAKLFFRESITRERLIVTLCGFAGVIVAFRPEYIDLAGFLALVTAFAVAGYNISVKWLPTSHPLNTLFWSNLLTLPITGAIAVFYWQPITQELLILASGACVCLLIYQACCVYAFQRADASAISVAEYSGLIFAALLGWLIFDEAVDIWTISGITLIVLPIMWQSWRENRSQKLSGYQ